MAGLDKIISQIKEESWKAMEHTKVEARSKADEILVQAHADAQREYIDIERHSKQVVASTLERRRTVAGLEKRRAVLAEEQGLIGAVIGMAKAELKELETGVYFGMTLKLAVKSAQPDEGELLLSKKDLERLSESLEDRLDVSFKDKGATLHILGDTRDTDGGLVLTYGGIKESCSIGTLFDATHGILRDKVREALFS